MPNTLGEKSKHSQIQQPRAKESVLVSAQCPNQRADQIEERFDVRFTHVIVLICYIMTNIDILWQILLYYYDNIDILGQILIYYDKYWYIMTNIDILWHMKNNYF